MNVEPAGMEDDSRAPKPQDLSAEQVQQILKTQSDALQSYLVATRPKTRRRSWGSSLCFMGSGYLFVTAAFWAQNLARTGRATSAAYCFLGALAFPLLAIIAYFHAKWIAKGLTTDLKYREILGHVIWGNVSAYLGICYILIFSALLLTGNLYPTGVFK